MRYNSAKLDDLPVNISAGDVTVLTNTATPRTLFAFGINHRTAPVEIREKLFLSDEEVRSFLALVAPELPECLVLSTCNRTEVYGVTDSPEFEISRFKRLLVEFKQAGAYVRDEHFFELISCSACQQLFSVATSIDSKVVGDLQILRQLRVAYSLAREEGRTGKILNQLFQRAFKVGKQTFTETAIHDGAVSASLAAVETALEIFGSLRNRRVLVLGAGETARLTAEALLNKNVSKLLVSNRTRANAQELLDSLELRNTEAAVVDFDDFHNHLSDVDIVISSTGSELPIIRVADLAEVKDRILLIDIAVPRDIDASVADLPNVRLLNIDDLHLIVNENHERRQKDLPKVKKLIAHEMVDFLTWYYTLPLLPSCERTAAESGAEQKSEILRIKRFLSENVSEIHKLYNGSEGNFQEDLNNHFALVHKLRTMKAEAFGYEAA
jgi:glutamyl-tRNA reductase